MPETSQTRTIDFDERKKELIKRTHITEIYNKQELYNIYINFRMQLKNLEQATESMKEELKELEPHFLKIKDEVEREKKSEKSV